MVFTLFLAFFTFLLIFMIVTLIKATYLINQAEVVIIERLGAFHKILTSGLHFVMPFVDQPRNNFWTILKDDPRSKITYRYNIIVTRIDLRETVYDFPRQNVITKDNVTIEISVLLYYQITDPKAAAYEVADLPLAIEKLTQTTMRNIIGSMDLDETLTSRDRINERLRHVLDDATEKWGVKVNRVELQEIIPPVDIRQAMEKQMRAERDRRALILEAEGQKASAILSAEGDYQSKVTRAKGEADADTAASLEARIVGGEPSGENGEHSEDRNSPTEIDPESAPTGQILDQKVEQPVPSGEMKIVTKEVIGKTSAEIPSGEEWHVEMVARATVTINNNAKLVVSDMAAKNKFIIIGNGQLEITGMDTQNEIERR